MCTGQENFNIISWRLEEALEAVCATKSFFFSLNPPTTPHPFFFTKPDFDGFEGEHKVWEGGKGGMLMKILGNPHTFLRTGVVRVAS